MRSCVFAGCEPPFEACIEELGAGAEQCDPLLLGQAPHHVTIRVEGEPSYNTMVAPLANALANQFHIIQPQVVK